MCCWDIHHYTGLVCECDASSLSRRHDSTVPLADLKRKKMPACALLGTLVHASRGYTPTHIITTMLLKVHVMQTGDPQQKRHKCIEQYTAELSLQRSDATVTCTAELKHSVDMLLDHCIQQNFTNSSPQQAFSKGNDPLLAT